MFYLIRKMADLRNYSREILFSVLAFLWLWFVLTNANINLGNAYLWAVGIYLFLLLIDVLTPDRNPIVTFQKKKGGWFEAIIAGTIGWVIILFASFVVLKIVEPVKASFGSILSSMGAANPAFSNSVFINWFTAAFAIGYAETQLFARLLKFFADRFNIQINKKSKFMLAFILLIIGLSIVFAIYHSTAKGVTNMPSLIIVGVMMAVSLFMVAYFDGETRQAVFTHIIANGFAGFLLLKSGTLLFSFVIPLVGG